MKEKKAAKLLVCYHKPDTLIKDEIMTPIHVGRAVMKRKLLSDDPGLKWMIDNMIGDDTGENISLQNPAYNELTSLYWAWKNYDKLDDPDYIGLMHYRRHFVLKDGEIKVYGINEMESPYYFDYINYSPEKLLELLEDCGFICHLGKVDGIYKHYLANHRIEDMELALKILGEKYPQYSKLAREYMAQDIGNFCNMFIFPKEMFFEYCEFIFSILEEFSNRTDISEKRFFISERLTGIFIYEKMQKGLKYKVLPINFVEERANVPIAYPLKNDNLYAVLLSMVSVLENGDNNTNFSFYLIHDNLVDSKIKEKYYSLCKKYKFCKIEFVESELTPQYYPLEVSEKLPKIKKLIYLNEKTVAMRDLSEFFRTCNVDDYYISGIPKKYAENESDRRQLSDDIFVLNCARFRKHKLYNKALKMIAETPGIEILNKLCDSNIGYFAEWFITVAGTEDTYNHVISSKSKSRGQMQLEALRKPLLCYGKNRPWTNIQGIYSNFWWNYTTKTPFLFKFPETNVFEIEDLLNEQQREINHIACINKKICVNDFIDVLPIDNYSPLSVAYEDCMIIKKKYEEYEKSIERFENYQITLVPYNEKRQENLAMALKIKRYYKQYGFKRTVKRIFEKFSGK